MCYHSLVSTHYIDQSQNPVRSTKTLHAEFAHWFKVSLFFTRILQYSFTCSPIFTLASLRSTLHRTARIRFHNSQSTVSLHKVMSHHYSVQNPPNDYPWRKIKGKIFRASLVAQWLRICLLMLGTRVRALVWEDPTCRGAAGPVSHNC